MFTFAIAHRISFPNHTIEIQSSFRLCKLQANFYDELFARKVANWQQHVSWLQKHVTMATWSLVKFPLWWGFGYFCNHTSFRTNIEQLVFHMYNQFLVLKVILPPTECRVPYFLFYILTLWSCHKSI